MRWSFLVVAALFVLAAPVVAVADSPRIERGTMSLRLDRAMVSAGLRFGTHANHVQRTMALQPGAPVSEATAGGRYQTHGLLIVWAGSRSLELRAPEVRISGGKGTLRARIPGRYVSFAKVRHASISTQPGRIQILHGGLRLTLQGAAVLRQRLRCDAITGHGTLGSVSLDVTTTSQATAGTE
jgi:hypothetical protein